MSLNKIFSASHDRTPMRGAFLFFVLLLGFEVYILDTNYAEHFAYLYDTQDVSNSLIITALIAISFYLFFYFALLSLSASWRYKIPCFLFFMFATFAEYGYKKAIGRFSHSLDIETIMSTTNEQKIASLLMYVNFAALVPCLVFLILLVTVRKRCDKPQFKNFFVFFMVTVFFYAGLAFLSGFFIERAFPLISTGAFCRTNADFLLHGVPSGRWNSSFGGAPEARRPVRQPTLPQHFRPPNNIIIVIDESVMGDHLSLNGYARRTTPFLEELKMLGILHNWGIAAAASTGSRFSYDSLIAGLSPDDFPDRTQIKTRAFPTLFQYAKAMKYRTYFFDGQMKGYWGGIEDDKNYIDKWVGAEEITASALANSEIDSDIARRVNEIISGSAGNFVFIFKHGSHIPYDKNFPAGSETWQPSYVAGNKYDIPSAEQIPAVVNAYDNSLKYNVDSFFRNLINDYDKIPNNTVILYTGDHGQTLFADRKASHGGTTRAEANVPLFIIGKISPYPDTGFKAAHQNLYPTVLDLMNYPDELRERRGVMSLLKAKHYDSRPRFFNPDLGDKISFD